MDKSEINELEDIVPHAFEHLVPEIQKSVERCIESFNVDPRFNDSWTFGTNLWKNIWNRFKGIFDEYEDCPFEICGKGNEYKFKIGPYILRHHRINEESGLPNAGNAVKKSAKQMCLFGDKWQAPVEIDNIVLAIDAEIETGLKEVFIGELKQKRPGTNKYEWGKKIAVYFAEGIKASSGEIIEISNLPAKYAPEEKVAEVAVGLDTTLTDKKISESDKET